MNKTLEEIKKRFERQNHWMALLLALDESVIKDVKKREWNFIESTISQTKQELIEEILKQVKKEWKWAKDNGAPEQNFEMIINMLTPIKLSNK